MQTSFIRELTTRAESVMTAAQTPELKAEAKKVYEAIRYSDPMSGEELAAVESEIAEKFDEFEKRANPASASEVIALVNKRAALCKLLKK